jgi:uncharacterized YigZ family protein
VQTAEDSYDTPAMAHRCSIREQRSEFIAIAFPMRSESDFQRYFLELQKEFHDAAHRCWGRRLMADGEILERSSDAGEPSGSAGRPILQAMRDAHIFDAGVVVVRYFGGVKLGTGGLARAYRDAARAVLESTPRERRIIYERIEVRPSYAGLDLVYRAISPPEVVLAEERFGESPRFVLEVRRSKLEELEKVLRGQRIPFGRVSR